MTQLVGFAGSLRAASYNRSLLAAAAAAMPEGSSLKIMPIDDIPLYNADIEEQSGIPASVAALKNAIADAAGLVIATPEYNGSIPGIAKNVMDWISRPGDDQPRVTHGKPVAIMGATPGGLGTAFSQAAWLQVLRTLRMRVWVAGGPFYLSQAFNSFDENGEPDADLQERLEAWMAGFVDSLS